ncbi:carbohydrate ABC transporter permease [Paenibacillus sp. YN15]|uniref:carbohydrate ABC transporter permease n=1 Tax=Paenibacillus sp. YN15 TaxID=1742774 RepID=UPI000DCE5134|nr:carbohydrate ABC transporter permease [Paenibacillus sp. YN15]RAU97102.1 carbohydrate ABC transporter permease [Paenibacillus sp. YN15]
MHKLTAGRRVFLVFNCVALAVMAIACILPLINVLAVSMSASSSAAAGEVKLWPVNFTMASYKHALGKAEFMTAAFVSVQRVALGYVISIVVTVLTAFPLAKEKRAFGSRTVYAWFFIVTMMFHGGLIPSYMTIKALGMLDTMWALVLPGALSVFNVILLMNFFRNLPKEIEEAAYIDGAGHWRVLWNIYCPLSKPAIATITLFMIVGHWNSWFDGLIYMNSPANYPLQSYLQTIVIGNDPSMIPTNELLDISKISDRTFKAAQVFLAAFPVLVLYPFLQKYFMKGLVMGSVKG